MKYVKNIDEANKMAMSYKLGNDDKHDVERMWFKEVKDKSKKPGDIKDAISKKLGINYFEISSYIDREILDESVNEADDKVTKKMWDRDWKKDFDKREAALLTVFDDPDDAEKWIDAKYDDLPPQASHMWTEKLEAYPLAKKPLHGSGDLGKEVTELATNMPNADPPIPSSPEAMKKKKEEEDEEAEEMAAHDKARSGINNAEEGGWTESQCFRTFEQYCDNNTNK